jgi:glucan phosphorylase
LHEAFSECLMEQIVPLWNESKEQYSRKRQVYYLSAEFLVGRAIYNNLLALGLTEKARDLFQKMGADLNAMEEVEDAALGNGGLGRLAACYMDSAATMGLPFRVTEFDIVSDCSARSSKTVFSLNRWTIGRGTATRGRFAGSGMPLP